MRLDFSDERVLAVVAHPDDAEVLCAGTLARARTDGAAIGICVLCRGDKGQPEPPIDNLADVRREETSAAAKLLDAELLLGDVPDAELADNGATRQKLLEMFRHFRPTLVLAHADTDYHPDHRAASALPEAVSWFCASKGHRSSSPPLAAPPALWWMDTVNMTDFNPDFYVDVSPYMELRRQMLACHRSQQARGRESDFSPIEELMVRRSEVRGAQGGVAAAEAFRIHRAWKRGRAW